MKPMNLFSTKKATTEPCLAERVCASLEKILATGEHVDINLTRAEDEDGTVTAVFVSPDAKTHWKMIEHLREIRIPMCLLRDTQSDTFDKAIDAIERAAYAKGAKIIFDYITDEHLQIKCTVRGYSRRSSNTYYKTFSN